MKLHDIRPNEGGGSRNQKRKRLGRGTATGQGKTAGRGQDGHTAKRVKFLMDKVEEIVNVIQRDKNRVFPQDMQVRVLDAQENKCAICNEYLILSDAEADHILEHSKGGLTEESNCQMVHKECHKNKTREFMKKTEILEELVHS